MKLKKWAFVALCAALALAGTTAFAGITVDIVAPQITFSGNANAAVDTALNDLFTFTSSSQFQTEIDQYETQAGTKLDKYGTQDKLAQGFADANVMASQAATLQGFEGYKTFAVSAGMMVGVQLPSSDPNVISDMSSTLADDPDVYLGVAPAISLNVGFNMGKVLGFFGLGDKAKRYYVNIHGGHYSGSYDASDSTFDMATTTFGIGVNYQLIQPKGVVAGLFRWRGVSIGSGFTYQRNTFDSTTTLDPIEQPFTMNTMASGQNVVVNGTFTATPKIDIGVDMKTFSIPLEAVTSVQLLWVFNVNAGLGADLVFGKSDITAGSSSDLSVRSVSTTVAGVTQNLNYNVTQPGSVTVDASSTDIKPTLARARIMGGIGLNAGPLKLDVPVYYYFTDGYGLGMTVAFVW